MALERIIANGVSETLKRLSSVVANEITLVYDFNDELKNLQSTLNMILDVMEDAENKQASHAAVRRWMEELKSIAYDAEDILDDYSYEVIICKREKEKYKSTVFNKVRNVFSSSKPSFKVIRKLAHQIKEINERFKIIANRKNDLGLRTIDVGSSSSHELMMKNRVTDSIVVTDWKFIGRENDKSTIIKMLLEKEEENSANQGGGGGGGSGKHVSVIPIVGMGGLGKTAMAQQVYNDEVVQKHFELKIWICVSDPFDIKKLWKSIANSIRIPKDDLACSLQNAFKGKKFILVLDDVWNEKSADWYKFKTPFMDGRKGSKILVTTRNENVALTMVDKFQPYLLGILNENDCWSLFEEIAFGYDAGAKETPNLVVIGKEMVKRCGGLPLAVIFLGSLMRSRKKEDEWKIIRDTKLWHESRDGKKSKNEILPSLRLSYDYLPSPLKLCFSYCCLFPKDYIIERETLIRLWMAEGFLIETPGENTMSMEEIGDEYFHSLLSSFFFQDAGKDYDGEIVLSCKMHDLVHDLAHSVVGNHECLIVENALDIDYISEETRRINLLVDLKDEEMLAKVIEAMKKAKKLRTVFVHQQTICFDIGNAFKENKRLRVLDFNRSHVTIESSSSIGGLQHLRYLSLPSSFVISKGIGRLRFLQTLWHFNVGNKKECKDTSVIEELEDLNLLRVLRSGNLKKVTSGAAACRANLKEKKSLHGLRLSWNTRSAYEVRNVRFRKKKRSDDANNNDEAVLEGLRPHPNLRTLEIEGFEGAKLPRWMGDPSCLPNLEELRLDGGSYEQVAGFGALPSLRSLSIFGSRELECLGNEFCYSAAAANIFEAFPSLEKFILVNIKSLEEWVVPPPGSNYCCFPLLEEITIVDCPVFRTITPTTTIFPSLKVLNLSYMGGRAATPLIINNLNSLTSLTLYMISDLYYLPRQGLMENNNTLLFLQIEYCHEFQGFSPPIKDDNNDDDDDDEGGGQQLQQISSSSCSSSSLQSLKLYHCSALRYYPNIRSLTSLRALHIEGCKESKSLQDERFRWRTRQQQQQTK